LKAIFEANLKLFDQHYEKQIVFVIRDFMAQGGNREATEERV